jgi:hypothetical protein
MSLQRSPLQTRPLTQPSNTMLKKLPLFLLMPIFTIAFVLPVAVSPTVAHAAPAAGTTGSTANPAAGTTGTSNQDGALKNPLKNIDSIDGLLNAVLSAIVDVLAPIFLTLAFIYVGFLFVMARGKEEQLRSAKTALVWTVIGGLILLGAKAIGLVISSTVSGL